MSAPPGPDRTEAADDPPRGFSMAADEDRLLELGRLAGGLVHELKNPLGVITMNADLLHEQVGRAVAAGPERERMERRVARIAESARNLQAIVQSFLHFARPLRPDPVAADVNAVIAEVIEEQAEANAADRVQIVFRPDEDLLSLPADPQHLASIFRNILVNAREALRERAADRRILIATRSGRESIRIVIANNGPAIPERIAAHLFQPFTSAKENGTGLGLAIVRRLVEMHRGTVHVSSDRDAGVSFTIEFPTPLGPAKPRTELPMPDVEAVVRGVEDGGAPATDVEGAPSPRDGAGAERRWRHTIGEADAATSEEAQPTRTSRDKARGVGPQGRRGEAPDAETGAKRRWADTMGEAHPPTDEEAKPRRPRRDKARGVGPQGRRGEAPGSK